MTRLRLFLVGLAGLGCVGKEAEIERPRVPPVDDDVSQIPNLPDPPEAPPPDAAAEPPPAEPELRVVNDPYRFVDWDADRRLLAQFHDHTKTSKWLLDPYDDAGYQVVPLMQYAGIPGAEAAWTSVHWPPELWLTPAWVATLNSIERFYPSTELAAEWHMTTPFLETYLERWDASKDPVKLDHHFETLQEAIDLVEDQGGYPVLAHPWTAVSNFIELEGLHAVEVYSSFGQMNLITGVAHEDPSALMVRVWDALLEKDPRLLAVAVNDWHGPQCTTEKCVAHPEAMDSGKVELIAHSSSAEHVAGAFAVGSMFALRHLGAPGSKPSWPRVDRIIVGADSIEIQANAPVRWISHGVEVDTGPVLDLTTLPTSARHVRAELDGVGGSRLWVQPFELAPISP